jgi:hypothetical protein
MKAFIFAVIAAAGLAAGAAWFMDTELQTAAYSAFGGSESVRLGDPGDNLVGPRWSGLPNS